jgi:two-component system chemotaxis response regulator CheB
VIAVILSGSGSDGMAGAEAVRRMGGQVIAQDRASSAFFGMPGAAIESGNVDFVVPLDEIGPRLIEMGAGATP